MASLWDGEWLGARGSLLASAQQPTFNCATLAPAVWPAPRRTSAPALTRSSLSSQQREQEFPSIKWKSNSAILPFRKGRSRVDRLRPDRLLTPCSLLLTRRS